MAPKRSIDRLLFVFNADNGSFNAFLDSARKFLRIKGCTLCTITHGLAGEKSEWRDCKEEIGVPIDYVHRDEVSGELRAVVGDQLPCVVAQTGNDLVLLLAPDVLDRCQGSVADLKGRLSYFAAINRLELPPLVHA
ncbi:MAG TPA: hypothetical protein VGG20_14145 [Thermoanaerobaculia bacterium]|jgi:hypothetical protein